jgi:hypothetical protein
LRQIFVTVDALQETASKDVPPIQPPAPFFIGQLVDLHLLSATAGRTFALQLRIYRQKENFALRNPDA